MTYYRAIITKTLETYLEFDEEELGDEYKNDPDGFAWDIARDIDCSDWNTIDVEVGTEEFKGELPELS